MANDWAKSAIDGGAEASLYSVQESLPVSLISTPRADFVTCKMDDRIADLVKRNHKDDFDFLPVIEENGDKKTIAGVLSLVNENKKSNQTTKDQMQLLNEGVLIGADASILDFIGDADTRPFRFIVAGSEISGLVTLSDLQRLPVRVALFAMVTQLELSMSEVIRRNYSDGWIEYLNDTRRAKIESEITLAIEEGTLVEKLLYTQFCDKVAILRKKWPFASSLSSKSQFRSDMNAIQKLRDSLAHANEFAAARDEANKVCQRVREMGYWLKELEQI